MNTPISYTLKITIVRVRPAVWWRILVPSDIKLPRLHAVIQIVTGAPDSLQHFFIDRQKIVYANPAWEDLPKIKPGRDVSLERLLSQPGDRLAHYCGDDDEWEHTVELLKITKMVGRTRRAACVAGNRHCSRRHEHRKSGFLLSAVNRALQRVRV
jgi:hypothetical protein